MHHIHALPSLKYDSHYHRGKRMLVFTLFWSYPALNADRLPHFADIQVKEIDKRASGQAFEVILSPSSVDPSKGEFPLASPKKKDISLEEIKRKLEAAEGRRRVTIEMIII